MVIFCSMHSSTTWETIGYLFLIALLWFLVGLEIRQLNQHWLSSLTPRTGVRGLADFVLVALGVALILVGLFGLSFSGSRPYSLLYAIWGCILIFFYGHDFWVCRGSQTPRNG